ncbi:MAG: MAPEG family protein [Alteromonadaceae bacterium]|nr:MAPEG family protein [Alteromonadaceae bacterium]
MATATVLAALIFWTLLLVAFLIGYRSMAVAKGQKAANEFSADGSDVDAFGQRLTRAHANCVESFPIIGGTLILALATDLTSITEPLVYVLLAARVVQTLIHLASTSVLSVQIRFAAFLVQLALCGYWLVQLAGEFI